MPEHETLRDDVRVGDIFLDETYGRPPRTTHLETMAREWNRDLVGVVYLSMRDDGKFAVLDGNHRVMACRIAEGDDATIPAYIYMDLTIEEEALYFHDFNRKRKALFPEDEFKAALVAGDHEALAINAVVESLGLHIGGVRVGGGTSEGFVSGIRALQAVYQSHGENGLREVLLTLRDSMGTGPSAIQATIVRGLALFAARYYEMESFDRSRLLAVLSTHSPAQLKSLAMNIRAGSPTIDAATSIGMAILQVYNHGLRGHLLPPWQSNVYGPAARERRVELARETLAKTRSRASA